MWIWERQEGGMVNFILILLVLWDAEVEAYCVMETHRTHPIYMLYHYSLWLGYFTIVVLPHVRLTPMGPGPGVRWEGSGDQGLSMWA